MSIPYCQGGTQMLLCRLLLGKPYLMKGMKTGCELAAGYTSHVSSKDGQEVVMFDESAMLPVYVVHFKARHGGAGGMYGGGGFMGGGDPGGALAGLGSSGPGPAGGAAGMGMPMPGMGMLGMMLPGMAMPLGTGVTMFAPPSTQGAASSQMYHSPFEGTGYTLGGGFD